MVLCSDIGLLTCDTSQSTIVEESSCQRDHSSIQSSSIYSFHFVIHLTLDMSNSVNHSYQDSKPHNA